MQLSSGNAAGDLRRQVLEYIRSSGIEPGSRLATEAQIVGSLKVSRSTVRRALDPLEKEGWIDRRAGSGTFVGARVRQLMASVRAPADAYRDISDNRVRRDRGIVRVAVLIYKIGDLAHDWYTPGILEGLSRAEAGSDVIVELLGDRDSDIDAISLRLQRSRPDALVVLSNQPNHAFVIRDAQKMGIPCFVSGTPHRSLGVPSVCEDNAQAVTLAAEHLFARGHRQIGLMLPRTHEPWVFERFEAFTRFATSAGIRPNVYWTPLSQINADAGPDSLEAFIHEGKLTALLPAGAAAMHLLDGLVRRRRLSVPGDVSVISFEQDHAERGYLGVADATRIRFPLNEMGQCLARMARAVVDNESIEPARLLPAKLVEGRSVADCVPPALG